MVPVIDIGGAVQRSPGPLVMRAEYERFQPTVSRGSATL